jgi:hypothetical protein
VSSGMRRLLLAALVCAVCSSANGFAQVQQERDILKEVNERRKLEMQRVTAECHAAHEAATKVAGAQPAKALVILKTMRDQLTANPDLAEMERANLLIWIDRRITWLSFRIKYLAPGPLEPGTE